MTRRPAVPPASLAEDLAAEMTAAGSSGGRWARRLARQFVATVGGPEQWEALGVVGQLELSAGQRRVATWLLATGRAAASAEYLLQAPIFLGQAYAGHHREFFAQYNAVAVRIGFTADWAVRSWASLAYAGALVGVAPAELTAENLRHARRAFLDAGARLDCPGRGERLSMGAFRAHVVLFHLGRLDTMPGKLAGRPAPDGGWSGVTEGLATPLRAYLNRLRLVRRPATVAQEEGTLREFGRFLTAAAPQVTRLADLRREHLEAYRLWLAERPARGGNRPVTPRTQGKRMAILRGCFERITEWGWADAPRPRLVHREDFPIPDRPLPRFLDDAVAARLLIAARAADAPFDRLAVEFLARTGLRVGEFLGLTVDAVVQIGSGFWLRVPIGKLHNDRYIPLHPQLKTMLDEWISGRPAELRTRWLWVERGRRISRVRVQAALDRATATAGIDHVTPHQLRHTLATQAINRGMSLEALAALLGHKSLSMTLVYARIADRTVAAEYFKVTEQVEALYDQPAALPAAAEGAEMRKLRTEMHRRMLGNGYCARPVEIDCHFESICESCTFFVTTIEFRPTLQRQRDDAAEKGQLGRQRIFDGLLNRLDTHAG